MGSCGDGGRRVGAQVEWEAEGLRLQARSSGWVLINWKKFWGRRWCDFWKSLVGLRLGGSISGSRRLYRLIYKSSWVSGSKFQFDGERAGGIGRGCWYSRRSTGAGDTDFGRRAPPICGLRFRGKTGPNSGDLEQDCGKSQRQKKVKGAGWLLSFREPVVGLLLNGP